jgi:hypothetical protein
MRSLSDGLTDKASGNGSRILNFPPVRRGVPAVYATAGEIDDDIRTLNRLGPTT